MERSGRWSGSLGGVPLQMMSTAMKRLLLVAVMLGVGTLYADERMTVVAVTPFRQYFNMVYSWERQIVAVRELVIIELMRDYDCVVLNRSYACSFALEDAIKHLGAICETSYKPPVLYGADLSFTGVFQAGVTNIECVLRVADLRPMRSQVTQTMTLEVSSIESCAPQIAQVIARTAGIEKRSRPRVSEADAKAKHTWVTLPYMVALPAVDLREKGGLLRNKLQLHTEAALLRDARNRLVDRTVLDAVSKEHALRSLADVPDAGSLAKLVGADRILIGLISFESGMVFHVNLLAVDAESTEVLAAVGRRFNTLKVAGEEAEKAVDDLLAALGRKSPLVAAGSEQRLREAQFYLAAAKADGRAYSFSSLLALVEHAEMAYLLAKEQSQVVEQIAATLCECAIVAPDMANDLRVEVIKIAEKMVGAQADAAAGGADLLVWRALAWHKAGAFAQGAELMCTLARVYPNKYDDEARWVCSTCLEAQGKASEALACIASCQPTPRVLRTRAMAYRRMKDDDAEFAVLSKLSPNQMRELLTRFIDLLAARKGPQAAVAYLNRSMREDYWLSTHADSQLQLAQYTLATGDRSGAAALCQRLWDVGEAGAWSWKGVVDNEVFKKRLEELKARAGASDEKWLKACEVNPFPTTCTLYIQPLGTVDMGLIEQVRAGVHEFFGARTVILPPLELSKDEPSFNKEGNTFDATRLLPDTVRKLKVPADALAVAMVTKEHLCTPDLIWINFRYEKKGVLCSYFVWAQRSPTDRAICLRNSVISSISGTLELQGRFPCITAGTGDAGSSLRMKFAFCPEVQARYRTLDLAAEQRKAIEQYRRSGATIVARP
jgi:hypothetical protein